METFQVISKGVSEMGKPYRQQNLATVGAAMGVSAKTVEQWCLPWGGEYDTGRKNPLDRAETLLRLLHQWSPETPRLYLWRLERVVNEMDGTSLEQITDLELLQQVLKYAHTLSCHDPAETSEGAALARALNRRYGAPEAKEFPVITSNGNGNGRHERQWKPVHTSLGGKVR